VGINPWQGSSAGCAAPVLVSVNRDGCRHLAGVLYAKPSVSLIVGLVLFFSFVFPFSVFILRPRLVLLVLLGLCKMTGSLEKKRRIENYAVGFSGGHEQRTGELGLMAAFSLV